MGAAGVSDDQKRDPNANEFFDTARRLRDLGISFVPIQPGTKEPPLGFNWGEWTRRLPDASEMYEWFITRRWHIAVLPGSVSGNLAILDYDGLTGYENHAARYPLLRRYPNVETGSLKTHLWVRLPAGKTTAYYKQQQPDGSVVEVRVANHYTLMPPSLHPSGRPYRWRIAPWSGIAVLELEEVGLHYRQPSPHAADFFQPGEALTEAEVDHLIEALRPAWKPGRHHDLALAIAGFLVGYKAPEEDAWTIIAHLMAHGGGDERDLRRAVRTTYAKATEGVSVAGWARLTDRHDPLVTRGIAARLDLLMRARRPDFIWEDGPVASPPPDVDLEDDDPPAAADAQPWRIDARALLAEPDEGETWLADGLVQDRTLLWIAGPGKTFKSFLGISMLVALASGHDVWNAFYVAHPVTCAYIQEESTRKFVRRRVRAVLRGYGLTTDDLGDRLHIITNRRVRLDRKEDLQRIIDEVVSETGARVILFDPYRSMHRLDENSSTDMQKVVDRMLWLRDRFGVTVIVVHHFGKQGDERRDRWDGDEMRGSSVLWAAGDGGLLVHPVPNADDRINVRLRLKEGRPPDDLKLKLEFSPDDADDGGAVRVHLIEGGAPGVGLDEIHEALVRAYLDTTKKRRGAWPTCEDVCRHAGLKPRTVAPMLAKLEAQAKIRRVRFHKKPHIYAPGGAPDPPGGTVE